jgi:hypothetical protein
VQPVGPLKVLLVPKQTALLGEQLGHAHAAGNASSASPASVRHTTEAVVKRAIDTQWEREQS